MAAQLGNTDDPKALVPGEPKTVEGAADKLKNQSDVMENVAADLGNIRVDGWEGPASGAFWEAFSTQKPNWTLGVQAMTSTADVLLRHAETLRWAQQEAAEAIELWADGEAASQKALDKFQADGGVVVEGDEPGAKLGEPGGPEALGFEDPGAEKRRQAEQKLERARKQLDETGTDNATTIDAEGGKGDGAPPWLAGPAAYVEQTGGPGPGSSSLSYEFSSSPSWLEGARSGHYLGTYGKGGIFPDGVYPAGEGPAGNPLGLEVGLYSANGSLNAFEFGDKGAMQIGQATAAGSYGLTGGLAGDASLSYGSDGLKAGLHGSAGITASADGSIQAGIAEAGASGKAFVGVEGGAEASVDKNGVHAGVNAFAGARAEGEVHGDVGGVGAGATGEVWAGLGAEANVNFGMKDGQFVVGGEAGVAVGVGGKAGGEITIDPGKVLDTAGEAADAVGQAAGKVDDAAYKVGDHAEKIAGTLNPFD